MLALGLANLACFAPSTLLAPLLVEDAFHSGSVAFGIMVAAIGCAGALASVITGRLPAPRRPVAAMWAAWIAAGIAAVLAIGIRSTVLIGGLIAAAAGAILLIPGVSASDKADVTGQPGALVPTTTAAD
jgi:hypothetical protein